MENDSDNPRASKSMNDSPRENEAWKLRFWTFFAGQSLSLIGSALTQFVLVWWITDTTGSVSALGLSGLAAMLPQAILGPLGGVLADRYNRQLLIMVSDMCNAACMVVLVFLFQNDSVELWHIYALMAVRSAMQAFQQPAVTASTPMLVPASFLPRAVGLTQSLQGVIMIGAAPLGALAMSLMPIGWALSIDVFTALLGIFPLLFFTIPQKHSERSRSTSIWHQFREGFELVWSTRGLRQLYILLTVCVMIVMPLSTLIPLAVKVHFSGDASHVAWVESLGGIGMIIGGGVLAAVAPARRVPWIIWGFSGACLAMAGAALMPGDMFWVAAAIWMVSATLSVMGNSALMVLLQSTIPNEIQGRAISLLTTIVGLASPIGLMIATPLGEAIGVRWLFVCLGILGSLFFLTGFLSSSIKAVENDGVSPDVTTDDEQN